MPGLQPVDSRTLSDAENFGDIVAIFVNLINATIPVVIALILLFVVWKMIDTWVLNAGDEKKVSEGKQFIVTSIIVVVVILSVWGIVALLRNSLFL